MPGLGVPPIERWAQRIQALAQTGLTYARDPYDVERYRDLQQMAAEMQATLTAQTVAEISSWYAMEGGYATPKVGVRSIVMDDTARILLVQERSDGLWCPPGGWADVGTSPSVMAVREVHEESGYHVAIERVLAVLDRDVQGHPSIGWHVYTIYFLCRVIGGAPLTIAETSDVGWFHLADLPPLSLDRVTSVQLERFVALAQDSAAPVWFD
jgi:ADP-ribose pyrophosphatase YjhB (NUDIX family)